MCCSIQTAIGRYCTERHKLGEFTLRTSHVVRSTLYTLADVLGPQTAITRLNQDAIERWLMNLDVGTNTKYTYFTSVRSFCRWCVAHRLIKQDPCAGIRGPRRSQPRARSVPAEGITKLLLECDERLALVVLLGVQEGLRRAEIENLSTSDVDTDNRLLRVVGKGNKERFVPISPETMVALDCYLAIYPAGPDRPLIRSYVQPDQRLTAGWMNELTTKAMRDAGVKTRAYDGKSMHALRHSCANDMLDHGADLRDVSEMLGHSGLAVTANVYARRTVAMSRLRDAAAGRRYLA